VQASPPSVAVLLPVSQQVTYKTVGIHAVSTGVPETGYIIESVATEPATITLVGMPSTLAGINFVETEPVDMSGASNSVVRQVHLRVPNGVTVLGEQTITVTVRISPLSIVQRIRLVPSVRGLAPELRLKEPLPTVEIEVAGPAPVLRQLRPQDFGVVVDVSGLGPGQHQLPLMITSPQTITVEKVTPATVQVELIAGTGPTGAAAPVAASTR
jgi:YbbR domain-containing protein